MVIELDKDPKEAIKDQQFALVSFYAPWCGDCKKAEEYEKKIEEDFKTRFNVYRFDASEYEAIADTYGVERYPTYIVFRKGKPIHGVLVEPVSEGELRNWLEIHLRARNWKPLRIDKTWNL